MSNTIQRAISQTMEDRARDRIMEMDFNSRDNDFIFADWSNWDEHIAWLLTANREEISDWIAASR